MTDDASTPPLGGQAGGADQPPPPAPAAMPAISAQRSRPELVAGAAFAGGLLGALILKRLGRD